MIFIKKAKLAWPYLSPNMLILLVWQKLALSANLAELIGGLGVKLGEFLIEWSMVAREGLKIKKDLGKGNSVSYWGVKLSKDKQKNVLKLIEDWIEGGGETRWIATVNPEFIMATVKDRVFKDLLTRTDLNVVDGVGLVWALEVEEEVRKKTGGNGGKLGMVGARLMAGWKVGRKILRGDRGKALVPGCELLGEMVDLASKKGLKVMFLGGWKDRSQRTAERFAKYYPGLKVRWTGGRPYESNEVSLKNINKFKPDFLFVAYAMKKQEVWIWENLPKLKVGVVMGVGRSLDYLSGDLKRAPWRWRRMGLEWLYSLFQEPKRFRRQLQLPLFIWKTLLG